MIKQFKSFLNNNPKLKLTVIKIYRVFLFRFKIISLSHNTLPESYLGMMVDDDKNNIVEDLITYTGFSEEQIKPYLLRYPEKHFESEFKWINPIDQIELAWYYRSSSAYLFANAVHPYVPILDSIVEGKVLDYGAGAGCNTIGLAKRGLQVDFLEISRLQADFIHFRAERKQLKNIREVRPYFENKFDPVYCIQDEYDAIIAMDVLEHIPNYHIVVKQFIKRLKPGGIIIENSPFDSSAEEIAIHVRPSVPIEEAMKGMKNVGVGIWKKEI